jgi:hypothetical protein
LADLLSARGDLQRLRQQVFNASRPAAEALIRILTRDATPDDQARAELDPLGNLATATPTATAGSTATTIDRPS